MDKTEISKLTENTYRTKNYIVEQVIYVIVNVENSNAVLSMDTFYRRTIVRDCRYLLRFGDRKQINGKRLPSNTYIRTYVE